MLFGYHIRRSLERIYKEQWLIIGVFLVIMILGINWGLPDRKRMELLVGNNPPTKRQLGLLGSHRKNYLRELEDKFEQAIQKDSLGQKDAIASHFWRKRATDSLLTEDDRLIAFRAFILGSSGMDERKVFSSLSRMDPGGLDFDPKKYIYGGAYIYPVGGILFFLKTVGLFHSTNNFDYYMKHPSDIAMMYIAGRALNVTAFVGTLILLALFGNMVSGRAAGTLGMLTYSFSTLVLVNVLISKPHLYASFWAFLAVFMLFLYTKERRLRFLIFSALSAGWAAGSILPAAFMSVMYPILLFDRQNLKRSIIEILSAWLGMGTIFLLTNPYLIINFDRYLFELKKISSPEGYGHAVFALNKITDYLKGVFLRSYAFPAAIFGAIYVFIACLREGHITKRIALFFLCVFFPLGFVAYFPKTTLFLGPLLCLFTGLALNQWVFRSYRISPVIKVLILCMMFSQGAIVTTLFARDYILDKKWYEPTVEWLASANINRGTSIGIFRIPSPVDTPPFPFLQSRLINMNKELGEAHIPDYVIIGSRNPNHLEKWEESVLRSQYRPAYDLGDRPSYRWLLYLRNQSDSRLGGWVYKRINLSEQ